MSTTARAIPVRPPRIPLRAALPWALAAMAALAAPYVLTGGFGLSLLCRMGIAIVFALSFNMLLGQGGMLDFGHAVFLGFGGFAAMHAMRAAGHGWWLPDPLLPLVGAAGGLAAALLAGAVATRRGETAFAMITLGLAELFGAGVLMFPSIFGGEEGINGDRSDGTPLLGIDFGSQFQVYYLIAAWAFVCALLMWRYNRHPARPPGQRGARQPGAGRLHRLRPGADPLRGVRAVRAVRGGWRVGCRRLTTRSSPRPTSRPRRRARCC